MMTTCRADKWKMCATAFRDAFFEQQTGQVDIETVKLAEQLFRKLCDLEILEAGNQ